jgi:hypothetical protein
MLNKSFIYTLAMLIFGATVFTTGSVSAHWDDWDDQGYSEDNERWNRKVRMDWAEGSSWNWFLGQDEDAKKTFTMILNPNVVPKGGALNLNHDLLMKFIHPDNQSSLIHHGMKMDQMHSDEKIVR